MKLVPTPPSEAISLARKQYEKAQKFTPNSTQHSRYLKWEITEVIRNTLIAIRSVLGTGKTEMLKALAAWAKEHGYKLIFVGYRNNLLRQTCDRIPQLYHVGDEDKIMLDSDEHLALCHHSAGKLDPTQMENVILILDECVSDLRDMISSKLTAGRNADGTDSRQVRLAHIQQLIVNSHAVVALDAYLTDTEVEFLQELRNFDFTHKIENTYKNKMDVRMVKKKSTATREVIDLAIANQGAILITSTTQKHCENLEKTFIRIGVPKEEIHRFDGSNTDSDRSKEFFNNPGAYLQKYKPRILIGSPTMESGISIDLTGYFIAQYHFHLGNLGIQPGSQFLLRYRDLNAPRVIYCEEQGMIDEGNSSSFSKWVKDNFDYRVQVDAILLQTLLQDGKIDEALRIIHAQIQEPNPWLKLAHKYKSIHNHEMQHLRELFIKQMRDDGYTVTVDGEDDLGCADTKELFEKVEMERQVIRSTQLYNAPTIEKRAYEAIKNNLTANESERIAATKYFLTQVQLPGIMQTESWSPELVQMVKFTNPGLIKQLENFHYLLNPNLAEINHIAVWMPVIETYSVHLPDQLERSRLALTKCGRVLGFHELLDKEISISDLNDIFAKVAGSKLYQSSLKVNINPNKPQDSFKQVKKWLKKFGIKLSKVGEFFRASPMKDGIGKYEGAPKYDALTPEIIEELKALIGHEFIGTHEVIQDLGKKMEELEIFDARGQMALVAGAARVIGIKVFTNNRIRGKDKDGKNIIPRIYTFTEADNPISDAIRDTHVRPTDKEIKFAHIYECVQKRLFELATRQQERIQEWKEAKAKGENPPIPIDDLADLVQIEYPNDLLGADLDSKRLNIEKGDRVILSNTKALGLVIDCRVSTWTTPKGNTFTAHQSLVEFEGGRQQWYDSDVLILVD